MTTDALRPRHRFRGDGWSVDVREDGDLDIYTLRGEFDFAVSPKLDEVFPADPGARRVVLDMDEAEYCDSSCLQVLLRLAGRLREAGGKLAVVTTVPAVLRPIELLCLGDVMPVRPSLAETLASWDGEA
ncbi:anti-anti-sigma factor [Amycolatopsis camponoti]|uniref:Anti-anti-sigma factor n=1 Tax=Amycolatopsis camponoti TaxID=2606593 RepID=A0A6I8MBM9_9PSEU|nr:STAS domain-containing protein [Amycolatopsis camponoti]VVJ25141.1 anti-anti-sigma factor [Amycolatopsis camponoti]